MAMSRCLVILTVLLCSQGNLFAKVVHDSTYRFSIDLPDSWTITDKDRYEDDMQLHAVDGDQWIGVWVFTAGKDKIYNFKEIKRQFRDDKEYVGALDKKPFFNLLRKSVSATFRPEGGGYIRKHITYRTKTLFVIYGYSPDGRFDRLDPIIGSFDTKPTLKDDFLVAKNNIGWLLMSAVLSFFPFAGGYMRKYRNKYKLSAKRDVTARNKAVYSLVLSILVFVLTYIALRDNLLLASTVIAVELFFWSMFVLNIKFFNDLYRGLFG